MQINTSQYQRATRLQVIHCLIIHYQCFRVLHRIDILYTLIPSCFYLYSYLYMFNIGLDQLTHPRPPQTPETGSVEGNLYVVMGEGQAFS